MGRAGVWPRGVQPWLSALRAVAPRHISIGWMIGNKVTRGNKVTQ